MASESEASCEGDPNFAVICGFFEKFGAACGLNPVDFVDLQEMLENTHEVATDLIELHIKLLRKARKSVSSERWERAIVNICHTYNSQDAWEIERFGYKKARIGSKLRVLKHLLEMQFDLNVRFKNEINKMSAVELRTQPLGKDKMGHAYWFQTDESCTIRVYKEDPDEETWVLVAKDRNGLVSLISQLDSNEAAKSGSDSLMNEDSNSLEIEKPILDTGQIDSNSDSSKPSEKKSSEEEEDELLEDIELEEDITDNSDNNKNRNGATDTDSNSALTLKEEEEIACISQEDTTKLTKKSILEYKEFHIPEITAEEKPKPMGLRLKPLTELLNQPIIENEKKSEISGIKNKYIRNDPFPMSNRKAVESASYVDIYKNDHKRTIEYSSIEEPSFTKRPRVDRPTLLNNKLNYQKYKEEEDDEDEEYDDDDDYDDEEDGVGDVIEEPLMLIKGEGSGKDNQCGNDIESPIIGEAVDEPVMFVYGEGCGALCQTGNEKQNTDDSKSSNDAVNTELENTNDQSNTLKKEVFRSPPKKTKWDNEEGKSEGIIVHKVDDKVESSNNSEQPKKQMSFFFGPGFNTPSISPIKAAQDIYIESNKIGNAVNPITKIDLHKIETDKLNVIAETLQIVDKDKETNELDINEPSGSHTYITKKKENKQKEENNQDIKHLKECDTVLKDVEEREHTKETKCKELTNINVPGKDEIHDAAKENPHMKVLLCRSPESFSNVCVIDKIVEESPTCKIKACISEVDNDDDSKPSIEINSKVEESFESCEDITEISKNLTENEKIEVSISKDQCTEDREMMESENISENVSNQQSTGNNNLQSIPETETTYHVESLELKSYENMKVNTAKLAKSSQSDVECEIEQDNIKFITFVSIDNVKKKERHSQVLVDATTDINDMPLESTKYTDNLIIDNSENKKHVQIQSSDLEMIVNIDCVKSSVSYTTVNDNTDSCIKSKSVSINPDLEKSITNDSIIAENSSNTIIDKIKDCDKFETHSVNPELKIYAGDDCNSVFDNTESCAELGTHSVKSDLEISTTADCETIMASSNSVKSNQQMVDLVVNKNIAVTTERGEKNKIYSNNEYYEKQIEVLSRDLTYVNTEVDVKHLTMAETESLRDKQGICELNITVDNNDIPLESVKSTDLKSENVINEPQSHTNLPTNQINEIVKDNSVKEDVTKADNTCNYVETTIDVHSNEKSLIYNVPINQNAIENSKTEIIDKCIQIYPEVDNIDKSILPDNVQINNNEVTEQAGSDDAKTDVDKQSNDLDSREHLTNIKINEESETDQQGVADKSKMDDSVSELKLPEAEINLKDDISKICDDSKNIIGSSKDIKVDDEKQTNSEIESKCNNKETTIYNENIVDSIKKIPKSKSFESMTSMADDKYNDEIPISLPTTTKDINRDFKINKLIMTESIGIMQEHQITVEGTTNDSNKNICTDTGVRPNNLLEDKCVKGIAYEVSYLKIPKERTTEVSNVIPFVEINDLKQKGTAGPDVLELKRSKLQEAPISSPKRSARLKNVIPKEAALEVADVKSRKTKMNENVVVAEHILKDNSKELVPHVDGRRLRIRNRTSIGDSTSTLVVASLDKQIINESQEVADTSDNLKSIQVGQHMQKVQEPVCEKKLIHDLTENAAKVIGSPRSIISDDNREDVSDVIISDIELNIEANKSDLKKDDNVTLATLSFDYIESPPSNKDNVRVTRKRGRVSPLPEPRDQETGGKRRKMRGKRAVDSDLRKSIEDQKKKEISSSEEEKEKNTKKLKKIEEISDKKVHKKKRTLLGLDIPDSLDSTLVQTGVRQSRRIAQIKIKEEAERRKIEELTMQEIKEKHKKKSKKEEDKDYKAEKRKRNKNAVTDDETTNDAESDEKKKKKRKRKHKNPKFDELNPWKSSSDSSSQESHVEEEEEEYEEEEHDADTALKSDHEFSPESDLENGDEIQPLKRARTVRKEDAPEDEESEIDDTSCEKCGKSDHPEWILLCDGCDSGWHCSCLRPALLVIPEGDWYCPPCQHTTLVDNLQKRLLEYDKQINKKQAEVRRKERLAYVGISLDNVLPAKEHDENSKVKQKRRNSKNSDSESDSESESTTGSGSGSGSSGSDSEDEPIYQLRQRRQAHSYRFNDYDELINSAIQDEVSAVRTVEIRGKDMATIVNAESAAVEVEPLPPVIPINADLPANLVQTKNEEASDDDVIKPVKKLIGKKKHRKLNSLDFSSNDDDQDSDEDFKGSSSDDDEEDDFDEDLDTDSSDLGRRNKRKGGPVRRSTRARISRYDRDFINDDDSDDDYDSPRRKKTRSIWDESESEESDKSWGRRKKRSSSKKSSTTLKPRKPKSKKKKKNDDSDADVYSKKKPKIKFGGLESEEDTGRRTRGKKITYVDALGSDSDDDIRRKNAVKDDDSEDEFVLNEEEDLRDEVAGDSDDSNDDPLVVGAIKSGSKKGKGKGGIKRIKRAQGEEEEALFPPLPDDFCKTEKIENMTATGSIDKEPNPIEQINKNLEAMDEKEMEMMMEEEEYANKQLQMVAEQLEKEKRRKEMEAAKKLEEIPTVVPQNFEVPMITTMPVLEPQLQQHSMQDLQQQHSHMLQSILTMEEKTPKKRGRKPKSLIGSAELSNPPSILATSGEDISGELSAMNLNPDGTPKKRRGRGKGKKTLEKEAAAAAAAAAATSTVVNAIEAGDSNETIDAQASPSDSVLIGGKLGVASAPQPFSQSQPVPSVITRMLQTQPGKPAYPVGPPINYEMYGENRSDGPSPPLTTASPQGTPFIPTPGGPRGVLPSSYRPALNHYAVIRSGAPPPIRHRSPGAQNIPPGLFHGHHPLDPSPSGGATVAVATEHGSPAPPASPLSNKSDHTPPPTTYVRPPMVRFPTASQGPIPRHPQILPQHLQRPNMPFSHFHYGPYQQAASSGDESVGSASGPPFNNPNYAEFSADGEGPKNYDEENGEFGGLVSYFSSQREDDLDT